MFGIQSLRAKENFPDETPFFIEWYQAVGLVKQACYITYRRFASSLIEQYGQDQNLVPLIPDEIIDALVASALEIAEGKHFDHFIVPALSGGAGTSINMNVNEIIANLSLLRLGKKPGDYQFVDPIEHANVFQSTNDVIPTALRLAIMRLLNALEEKINGLRNAVEKLETSTRNDLRIAYTQMQEAVPSSYGMLFSTFSEALSRDWWRVSRCFERIKVVNLGGSAVGTGIGVPRFFIMQVVQELQKLSGLPLTRSENLPDATSNLDPFVEIHAILKAHAVNLGKMVSDLRLLASDIAGTHEVVLPQKQIGSTIMPAKVNPVIAEFVIIAAHKIYANDNIITALCAQGCLELNAYLPLIGHSLLESLKLLIACDLTLKENLFTGLTVDTHTGASKLFHSPAITTALSPYIGYHKAAELARMMKSESIDIFEANRRLSFMEEEKLKTILKPENLLKLGYSLGDLH